MDEAIHIRKATPEDYDPIVSVMDDWWGRTVSPVLPRLFLDHFYETSFIAESKGTLSGFLVGFFSPARQREAYIHFSGVDPIHRGTGIGRSLYERFFDTARDDGRDTIRAITPTINKQSIIFHRSLGFDISEPVADYHGPARERIIFNLRI
ncbi:GNAT family N-acetyltransferase [Streptomyces sp. NPDC005962]|uniref:GNAT family N-acetyltransferase n=1 Tax=Streptomyces sp. NPDC005962 TaxID=3154466 RepID=UPI00340B65C2